VLGRARCVAAKRNGRDVFANDGLSLGTLAEVDRRPATRRLPVLIRRCQISQTKSALPISLPMDAPRKGGAALRFSPRHIDHAQRR